MATEATEYLIQKDTLEAIADSIRLHLDETNYVFIPPVNPGVLLQSDIIRFYYEEIDAELGETSAQSSVTAGVFHAAGYEENNEGIVVPVLYEFINADSQKIVDRYFYVGQGEIQGTTYDRWRKIEEGAECSWDSQKSQYVYTNVVIAAGNAAATTIDPTYFPNKIAEVYAAGLAAGEASRPIYTNGDLEVY